MSDIGTGTTIAFATSGFTAEILSINIDPPERPTIETTTLSTTGARTFTAGSLVDHKTFSFEYAVTAGTQPIIADVEEIITITFPVPTGGTTGAKLEGTGFAISGGGANVQLEERITDTITVQWSDAPTWTASA